MPPSLTNNSVRGLHLYREEAPHTIGINDQKC